MQTYVATNGREYPISDGHLIYPEGWNLPDENTALDNWRAGRELTVAERAYLSAWTNRNNLENAIAFLGDKEHTDYFGVDGTLDQVHGQAWHPDICDGHHTGEGCVVHTVWDHHKRDDPAGVEHQPHRSHRVCSRHGHLDQDHVEHHTVLLRETQHKEAVVGTVQETYSLDHHERPAWHFTEEHELVIDTRGHPTLKPHHVREVVQREFPDATVHVR